MSLKAIVKAGNLGAALVAIRNDHASLANRLASASDPLPALLLRGGEPVTLGAVATETPALSGGVISDEKAARAHVSALLDLVAVPSAEEWMVCSDGLLSEEDCKAACDIIRARAVLRFVAEATGAVLPPNDI